MPIVMPVMVSVVGAFSGPGSKSHAFIALRCAAVDRVAVSRSGAGVVNGETAHGMCYPRQYGNTLGFRGD